MSFKHIVDSDEKDVKMFLIGDGMIMRNMEITVKIGCNFNYRWLPWDW
jgi:hypothetical protein